MNNKNIVVGVTNSDFSFEFERKRLENFEFVEALSELRDDENVLAITRVIKLLLGQEQLNLLKDHVRDEDGIVPTPKIVAEFEEILLASKDVKN